MEEYAEFVHRQKNWFWSVKKTLWPFFIDGVQLPQD